MKEKVTFEKEITENIRKISNSLFFLVLFW